MPSGRSVADGKETPKKGQKTLKSTELAPYTLTMATKDQKNGTNPLEYLLDGEAMPVYLDGNGQQRRRAAVSIDALLLLNRLNHISTPGIRLYLFLLSRLESNSKPIKVHSTTIKLQALPGRHRGGLTIGRNQLINSGLIFYPHPHIYYINPMFAWSADSVQCFNPQYLAAQPTREEARRARKSPTA